MMNPLEPKQLDIRQIYARYCDIVSQNDHATARELLSMLSHSIDLQGFTRNAILNDLTKLMPYINLSVNSRQYSCFYDFVFFICCENGQKNITVSRAITAWKFALAGRFRLLNRWCCFVEEHQRHNISVDTWQQLLAFSRCVNEDLDGYDPKGAWPVLIDDFVEHMYSINQSSSEFNCSCSDMQAEPSSISNTFQGLTLLPGSKRKHFSDTDGFQEEMDGYSIKKSRPVCLRMKRVRQSFGLNGWGHWESNINTDGGLADKAGDLQRNDFLACLKTSGCKVEDSLGKGFEGHFFMGCCFQFENRGSYT